MNINSFSNIQSLFFENKGLKQTVFKNTFWLVLAEGITKISKLFLIIYIARILGATEYGKLTFALSFVSTLIFFSDLGLHSLTIREISQEREGYFSSIFSLKLILGFFTIISIFIGSFFITSNIEIQRLIWILGIYALANSFSTIIYSFFQAKQKMEYEAISKIIQAVLVVALGFFILFYFPSIENLSFIYLLASLSALFLIFLFFYTNHYFLKLIFDKKKWIYFLNLSYPIALYGIFGVIYNNIDLVIMGHYNQMLQSGWYNAAIKLIDVIVIPVSLISISFFPILNKAFNKSKEKFQKIWSYYLQLIFFLTIPLVIGGFFLAPRIINFVYGNIYSSSILVFRILIIVAGFFFISMPFGQILFIFNRQKKLIWVALLGAVISIFLNLIFITIYSLYGAAIIRLIAFSSMFLLLLILSLKLCRVKLFNIELLLSFINSCISSILMYFVISGPIIYNYSLLISLLFGIVSYLLFFFIIKKIINFLSFSFKKVI